MSRKIAEELLPRLRQHYMGRGREGCSRLIDELCEQWEYSRKHAIKLLGGQNRLGWRSWCSQRTSESATKRLVLSSEDLNCVNRNA